MFKLSRCSKTFMKLSGCFSEMTASLKTAPVDEIFLALQPYLVVLLATFGPFRYVSGKRFSSHLECLKRGYS
jgi:L-rhamnono-1,4-lactonase